VRRLARPTDEDYKRQTVNAKKRSSSPELSAAEIRARDAEPRTGLSGRNNSGRGLKRNEEEEAAAITQAKRRFKKGLQELENEFSRQVRHSVLKLEPKA